MRNRVFVLISIFIFVTLTLSCNRSAIEPANIETVKSAKYESKAPKLTIEQANRLAKLPMKCISQEYPNKLGQILVNEQELGSPKKIHPSFYGCFDWHSAVHAHWVLVKLLNDFPGLENKNAVKTTLINSISKANIETEFAYLNKIHEGSFERTYGWAWLLKLAQELGKSNDSEIKDLEKNLQPLADLLVKRFIEFLPKLNYPVRVGTHSNSAFGMSFAYDYAKATGNQVLQKIVEENAKRLHLKDEGCPLNWEPNGTDFLSPCFEELNLMRRILPKDEFFVWSNKFLPQIESDKFDLEVGKVSDRNDGHLVHLDGLNFSRAWIFYGLAKQYPEKFGHLTQVADKHLNFSLPVIVDGNYSGEHWLGSFALYALSEQ